MEAWGGVRCLFHCWTACMLWILNIREDYETSTQLPGGLRSLILRCCEQEEGEDLKLNFFKKEKKRRGRKRP